MKPHNKLLYTDSSGGTFLVRIMVGIVFLQEGIQKFAFPVTHGAGRFSAIGIPFPTILAPFTGFLEIACSIMVLLGCFTRFFIFPLLVLVITSITAIKLPMLMGQGIWATWRAMRTDWCMLMGCLFLLFKGSGTWSLDRKLSLITGFRILRRDDSSGF